MNTKLKLTSNNIYKKDLWSIRIDTVIVLAITQIRILTMLFFIFPGYFF
jgi:hypothetical protein